MIYFNILEQYPTRLNHSAGCGLLQDQGFWRGAYWTYGQADNRRNWAKPQPAQKGFRPTGARGVKPLARCAASRFTSFLSDRRADRETEAVQSDRILL